MKKLMLIATLLLTGNTYSRDIFEATDVSVAALRIAELSVFTSWTLGAFDRKAAAQILNDSQEYLQSGNMTAYLKQSIKNVQSLDASISDTEALDALISVSENTLK